MEDPKSNNLKITFFGAAQEVTGSCNLVESPSGKRILVDCGMHQGSKLNEEKNREDWPFNPSSIEAVFVTHAHLDHVGRIPMLFRSGFKGKIYSTAPTKDLAQLVLLDSSGVLEKEAGRHGGETLYDNKDIEVAMSHWEFLDYHQTISLGDLTFELLNAGHIMGSSMIKISYNNKKVLFTGDMGNYPNPFLRKIEDVTDVDTIVMEALYGDKNFAEFGDTSLKLERIVEGIEKNKGVLMIPAFSIERTQKILFQLNDLMEHGKVGQIPVFLDSPLAIKATQVYEKYSHLYFNEEARNFILKGDDLLKFAALKMTIDTQQSKQINKVPAPKIIIAGSGMSNGGRILHHEKLYLSDPKSVLLIVSYQAPRSLGRMLADGAKMVNIMGEEISVNASVVKLEGYSSHPDMDKLLKFVEGDLSILKKVFVVHSEPETALFFVQRLRDYLGVDAYAPEPGETREI